MKMIAEFVSNIFSVILSFPNKMTTWNKTLNAIYSEPEMRQEIIFQGQTIK